MENRFAAARRRYLREHRDGIYTGMLLTGKLDEHLKEIGDTAQEMFNRLVAQMKDAEGVTEQLKAENQMEWVGRMNSIRSRAEEVVLSELVYGITMDSWTEKEGYLHGQHVPHQERSEDMDAMADKLSDPT